MTDKNPHPKDTPEWQLFENMEGAEAAARAYDTDSQRYLEMAAKQRARAELFRRALVKLSN